MDAPTLVVADTIPAKPEQAWRYAQQEILDLQQKQLDAARKDMADLRLANESMKALIYHLVLDAGGEVVMESARLKSFGTTDAEELDSERIKFTARKPKMRLVK